MGELSLESKSRKLLPADVVSPPRPCQLRVSLAWHEESIMNVRCMSSCSRFSKWTDNQDIPLIFPVWFDS